MRGRADAWARAAAKKGFPARSVFKLEAADRKFKLFGKKGLRVLDLGAAPGSWSLYAAERGAVVTAIDMHKLGPGVERQLPQTATVIEADVRDWLGSRVHHGEFDLVLSDMAPKTTGVKDLDAEESHALCELALDVGQAVLDKGGALVVKMFQSGHTPPFRKQLEGVFKRVHLMRPQASQRSRTEVFLVGQGFKRPTKPPEPQDK